MNLHRQRCIVLAGSLLSLFAQPASAAEVVNPYRVDEVLVANVHATAKTTRAEVAITLSSTYYCPAAAVRVRELEGSIKGSHGIDQAVTYFVPDLDLPSCQKKAAPQCYRLVASWERRNDTPWTIAVPGYLKSKEAFPAFKLFKAVVDPARPGPEIDLQEKGFRSVETQPFSLTNGPEILSADLDWKGPRVGFVLNLKLQFASPCEAEAGAELQVIRWEPDGDTRMYVWVLPVPGKGDAPCPELYNPVQKSVSLTLPNPRKRNAAVVLVPNFKPSGDLPVLVTVIAVH
jgi:hypothetical protein